MNPLQKGAAFILCAIFALMVLATIVVPAPYARQFRDVPNAGPSTEHPLGTDALGRDSLSRLLYGTRVSLLLAPAAGFALNLPALSGRVVDDANILDPTTRVTLTQKLAELEEIKAILRDEAKGQDIDFKGTGANVARVEQKADTICRVVTEDNVPKSAKLAGEHLTDLFTIHPSKGREKSFELNALKLLTKRAAQALIDLLTVEATAWVRFS